tara:strand:- start:4336 stop:4854 length:519 start_codon:yes stop_codon:yes gene_type:complete
MRSRPRAPPPEPGEDATAQRCWTPAEDGILLTWADRATRVKAGQTHHRWSIVVDELWRHGFDRSENMIRNRYQRILKGRSRPGRNRCSVCGQQKAGHSCPGRWVVGGAKLDRWAARRAAARVSSPLDPRTELLHAFGVALGDDELEALQAVEDVHAPEQTSGDDVAALFETA